MPRFSFSAKKTIQEDIFLFVHIPKTAGTSFRFELERKFPRGSVVLDYGPDSPFTSEIVRRFLYSQSPQGSPAELVELLRSERKAALVGHYRLSKYASAFAPGKVVSFVREPLLRCASEFLHKTRQGEIACDFTEFFTQEVMVNRLTSLLDVADHEAIIGTTESYKKSLRMINRKLAINIKPARKNTAPKGGAKIFVKTLEQHVIDLFHDINRRDYDFYKTISQKFSNGAYLRSARKSNLASSKEEPST